MRFSSVALSEAWIDAIRKDDVYSKIELLDQEIATASAADDTSKVYGLMFDKFCSCKKFPSLAYPILECLAKFNPSPEDDCATIIARILWEDIDDALRALEWLGRHDLSMLQHNQHLGVDEFDSDWWEFIALGIRLGALCQLDTDDAQLKDILRRLERYIYLGNLCQSSLLKSLHIVIKSGQDQTNERISSATADQAERLLWWIWADAKRQERFIPDTVYDTVNTVETLLRLIDSEKKRVD